MRTAGYCVPERMVTDEFEDSQHAERTRMDDMANIETSLMRLGARSPPRDHSVRPRVSSHMSTPHPASFRFQTRNKQTFGSPAATGTSRLLALPRELRDLIWIHTVTELAPASGIRQISPKSRIRILEKRPIRMDRLNRPRPAPITRVSRQVQAETLPLYYQENIFECWRPLFWKVDWSGSTLIDWLNSLRPQEVKWLRQIFLLYKAEDELEYDVEGALLEHGYELNNCNITSKLELSEYEQCFEELGLPRHFGKKRRNDRYGIAHTNAS